MDRLHPHPTALNATRTRAVEDAQRAQRSVVERADKAGEATPGYVLEELIGKGSYGRVYKGKDKQGGVVAVKIIDLDASDRVDPRYADTYSEFLKEIAALKVLSAEGARNVNHILDAFPVGQTMWMVTEYCGGGSVATLMRPKPSGLEEKWIIPILREVAEALGWVHRAGIIHRDVKCANIFLTTHGSLQLGDFGVAAHISPTTSKRSTFIGTPHWMAPELFASSPSRASPSSASASSPLSYGKEADIWAFGAVVYELAAGLPPNAATGVPYGASRRGVGGGVPRLEGGRYSEGLRGMAGFCLVEDPDTRPGIEEVKGHEFIRDTSERYPTTALVELVERFRVWEEEGGSRESLFMPGGAAGRDEDDSVGGDEGEWNFETLSEFEGATVRGEGSREICSGVGDTQATARAKGSRRRPPLGVLAPLRAPIEKLFDANTLSNYESNSRAHYFPSSPNSTSDLPLRDRGEGGSRSREAVGGETLKPSMRDTTTITAEDNDTKRRTQELTFSLPSFDHTEGMEEVRGGEADRRTRDWTFATSVPLAADTEGEGLDEFRDRTGEYGDALTRSRRAEEGKRESVAESLIDLDMSLSPSAASPQGRDVGPSRVSVAESLIDLDMSFLPSPSSPSTPIQYPPSNSRMSPAPPAADSTFSPQVALRALPAPPSVEALSGAAGAGVVGSEMGRLLGGLVVELGIVRDVLSGSTVV
ncbi:hypothetical protein V497_00534 [Pseudogymnoascus sp. VKM F-4516 (FW-969)]|nr:hypothetical protein V497_00534 [Pseudogymnoascus sp. VKM F-4516 (FW-969)]